MSDSVKNRNSKILICPYCGKEGKSSGMLRWHFGNCKSIPNSHFSSVDDVYHDEIIK